MRQAGQDMKHHTNFLSPSSLPSLPPCIPLLLLCPPFTAQVPPEMFFLFRMLGLIRGLCTTLEVKLPYLEIMADYAQKGLVLGFERKVRCVVA